MIQVHTRPQIVGPWVVERLPEMARRSFDGRMDAFTSLGYSRDGRMEMGVLFSDHSPVFRSVHAHLALENVNGSFLRTSFGHAMLYSFGQLGCVRITANIPKRHKKMRNVADILGFKEEGCLKHGFLTDDCMVYGLTKRDAEKWMLHALRNQHNLNLTGD